MAVTTISRTSFTDDTGDGISGDIWNATLIGTSLYDPIDALLANALELGGALTTGGQLVAVANTALILKNAAGTEYMRFVGSAPSTIMRPGVSGHVIWQTGAGVEMMRVTAVGNLGVGAATVPGGGTTTGVAVLTLGNGTAPVGGVGDQVSLYSADVSASAELFALDEAGNTPQLTPHNFTLFDPPAGTRPAEQYPWSYYASNVYLGLEIGVDMARLVTLVEDLTGETLAHVREIERHDWIADQETARMRRQAAVEAWEQRPVDRLDEPRPPLPRPHEPPAWLADRIRQHDPALMDRLAEVRDQVRRWTAQRPQTREDA